MSSYGLPGIIIFAMASVIIYQQRLIIKLYDRLFDTQESRRQESVETAKELNATLQAFSQSTAMLVDKIKIARGEK